MELKNIRYRSAVFFAVLALLMYFIMGILQVLVGQDPTFVAMYGAVSSLQALVYTPLLGMVLFYLLMVLVIFIYNVVARKYPVEWTIKK